MRNFLLGLFIGIVVTALWAHFTSENIEISDTATAKIAVSKGIEIDVLSEIPTLVSIKNVIHSEIQEPHFVEKQSINSEEIKTNKSTNELRQIFNDLVANISDDKLPQANAMLDSLLQITPENVFETEKRANAVAAVRENDLENKFYEMKIYNGLSELKTIECKTSICKVEITLPDGATYSPFPLLQWDSSLKSSNYHPNLDEDEENTMVAYFGIESSKIIEKDFDLELNSSN